MNMSEIKMWNLPKGAILKLESENVEFLGMDGMYGRWLKSNGDVGIANFSNIIQKEDGTYFLDLS